MKDINDLVQEFWRTSSDGASAVGAPFFEMRRLLEILQACVDNFEVCYILSVLVSRRLSW